MTTLLDREPEADRAGDHDAAARSQPTSPIECIATARATKAVRLVAECRARGIPAARAERLDDEGRRALAGLAGTRIPSEETWAYVVALLRTPAPTVGLETMLPRLRGLLRLWAWDADDAERLVEDHCDRWLFAAAGEREEVRRLASRLGGEATVLRRVIGELEHAVSSVEDRQLDQRDEGAMR
jgi:hypothetical protein